MSKKPVIITTDKDKRGVFMGFIDPKDAQKDSIIADEVRMAVYWDSSVKGILGLANGGPNKKCRITDAAPRVLIKGVTAVIEITDNALAEWRKGHWG